MAFQELQINIKGVSPTLMHNGQLADPLNKFTKALKVVTSKRKKTDDDHEEMARLEFLGSLYVTAKGEPCWPGECIEAMFKQAAGDCCEAPASCKRYRLCEHRLRSRAASVLRLQFRLNELDRKEAEWSAMERSGA